MSGGYGPGPYLFEGPEGLDAALGMYEQDGFNLLQAIKAKNRIDFQSKQENE
jgi:hypothetical protein